jgi:hypothetical protein
MSLKYCVYKCDRCKERCKKVELIEYEPDIFSMLRLRFIKRKQLCPKCYKEFNKWMNGW